MSARAVLIVEDADTCSSTLAIALDGLHDLSVQVAANGAEAWKRLESGAGICALLTDVHMPVLDGFALIERVRSSPRYDRLPILVLSGCTDPETPGRVMRLGADAYFEKPYSPAQVRDKLEKLLYERNPEWRGPR